MHITPKTRIGWIGTGIMGRSMALKIREAGFSLSVFNRTKSKAADLLDAGAVWKESPRAVAADSEIVFLIVGFPGDVRETVLGEQGVLAGFADRPHSTDSKPVVVDMTTSSPALAREIETACEKQGVVALDAPVSGGDVGARNGTLSIMIGGDRQAADNLMPLWNLMGRTIVWQGAAGSGQHTKMVNQTLIAGNMIGVCEALLYAKKAGLDLRRVLESVSGGAAGSWSLSNLAPRILDNDFAPGFMIEHFVKDLGIVLDESRRMGLCLPGIELAEKLYQAAIAQGRAKNGTQALYLALEAIQADS